MTDGDDFVHGRDDDAIVRAIAARYLHDASIGVVLVGDQTWSRRYIDWEAAALLHAPDGVRRGILVLRVPGAASGRLPARLALNIDRSGHRGCVVSKPYPECSEQLEEWSRLAIALARATRPLRGGPLLRRDARLPRVTADHDRV